ncbi:bactofilin family protein [Desulfurobacterium crinifex]
MIKKKESNSSTEIKSILAEGLKIEGNVIAEGKIRIDGEINGDIKGDYIILGETSKIKGNILSEFIVIMGTVEGNISSREVEIKTTGKIRGDIVTQKLSIEPGASIEGTLRSGDFYENSISISSIETVE